MITNGYRNYVKPNVKLNWHAASDYCRNVYGTELATISNSIENARATFVCHNVNSEYTGCWIGLNDLAFEGQWRWESNAPVTYTDFISPQPDNAGNIEHCITRWSQGRGWNDYPCTFVLQFLCDAPTNSPTTSPTKQPTMIPTNTPSYNPTKKPTLRPTNDPTTKPAELPTKKPTIAPTLKPSDNPTKLPTISPTKLPSKQPTNNPSYNPSVLPSTHPSYIPSLNPSKQPIKIPTNEPTYNPTQYPSTTPLKQPSNIPTNFPTNNPNALNIDSSNNANKGIYITLEILIIIILSMFVIIMCIIFFMHKCYKTKDNNDSRIVYIQSDTELKPIKSNDSVNFNVTTAAFTPTNEGTNI